MKHKEHGSKRGQHTQNATFSYMEKKVSQTSASPLDNQGSSDPPVEPASSDCLLFQYDFFFPPGHCRGLQYHCSTLILELPVEQAVSKSGDWKLWTSTLFQTLKLHWFCLLGEGRKEKIIKKKSHIVELEKVNQKSQKCSMLKNILLLIHWHRELNFTYNKSTTGRSVAISSGVTTSFSV